MQACWATKEADLLPWDAIISYITEGLPATGSSHDALKSAYQKANALDALQIFDNTKTFTGDVKSVLENWLLEKLEEARRVEKAAQTAE